MSFIVNTTLPSRPATEVTELLNALTLDCTFAKFSLTLVNAENKLSPSFFPRPVPTLMLDNNISHTYMIFLCKYLSEC